MEDQLPAFLAGDFQPKTTSERLGLAELCANQRRYRRSAEMYAEAFAAEAQAAHDHRYYAACYASLASAGRGDDAGHLDDTHRAQLRHQALGWLRQDLVELAQQLENGQTADVADVRSTLERRPIRSVA